jgi:hypothetical protein
MDRLPFFELEELLDSLKDLTEKEEEERKKKEGKERGSMPNFNVNSMMSRMNSGSNLASPSLPNMKF